MKKLLPLIVCSLLFNFSSRAQAVSAYTNCPDVNIAIARAGDNSATTNPYFLYNVNQTTGAMTLVPGAGFKDPANPSSNLQVNAIGVSKKDGFIYGLTFDGTVSTGRFVRLDKNYGVTSFGNIPSPSSSSGTVGIVNSAAGETDTAGNYFFTGATVNPVLPNPTLDKFFLGKIANTAALTTGPATVVYYEVDLSNANCSNYVSTFSTDPSNSGLKDFSYNAKTNTFFAYVTYKPTGAPDFSGQVMEIKPIAGSSPLKYQLICNPVVNHHNAEVSGTLIDKLGNFTILFTDGSFGSADRDVSGSYNGHYTQITSSTGLPNPLRGDMASCGQQTFPPDAHVPFTTCPDVNVAVVRAGTNADTQNPYYIYSVNTTTGALTQYPGGPLVNPGNPSINLQVNAVGINKTDGFMYGLVYEGTVNTARFVRFDYTYGVTLFGNVPPPTSPTGFLGFVNSAAGDIDRSNNYYFSGFTANPAITPSGYVLDKLFLGKISNISTVAGTPTPTYFEVDYSDALCNNYISTLTTDPNNSGIKDITFNPVTNTFFVYATYKPTGAANFSGQLLELRPIAGSVPLKYKLFCNAVVNTHTAETSGSLIDKAGNFLVLLTDGTIGKMQTSGSPFNYSGVYLPLNNATGLPNPLRGDMASCGGPAGGPLPVTLSFFNANSKDCRSNFSWRSENEINVNHYDIEQSFDNLTFTSMGIINAKNIAGSLYSFTLPAAGRQAYYRLKMIDNDGRISYSNILPLNNSCNNLRKGFVINPNPAETVINLNWFGISNATTMNVNIYNAYGALVSKAIKSVPSGSSVVDFNVSALAPGMYFIKATDIKTNESLQQRFVKQ